MRSAAPWSNIGKLVSHLKTMDLKAKPRSRLFEELESLRHRITELQGLLNERPHAPERMIQISDHALSNLRLHEGIRDQSVRDPLTGLYTERFMEESLDAELSRALRNQKPLGLIEIDVDHFDTYRTNLGHDAGITIIRELGDLLQANVRKEDLACRSGERRFVIVLPQSSLEITRQRADHLRNMIRNLELHHRGDLVGRVTVSAGVAVFPDHGHTVDALLQGTDGALKKAQETGGDSVVVAQE